jgi:hypothetical protein
MPFQEENDHCPCEVDDGKKAEQLIRIRHLIFTLNAERRDVLSAIADIEPKVAALSQIIGNAIQ